MLIASLAVPHAFGDDGVIFGVAYLAVRVLHLGAYAIVSRDDPQLRDVVVRMATTMLPASMLHRRGRRAGRHARRALMWAAALAVDYGGLVARGIEGWRVVAGHFSERHGLVIIIALGESIVALGVGAEGLGLDAGIIVGALLGRGRRAALWWAYFDFVALAAARVLRDAPPDEQVRIARDSLHLPAPADGRRDRPLRARGQEDAGATSATHLDAVPAVALCGGVALYLVALSAFKRRNIGSCNCPRLVAAAALAVLAPIATAIPALLALALVAASVWRSWGTRPCLRRHRDRVRHG